MQALVLREALACVDVADVAATPSSLTTSFFDALAHIDAHRVGATGRENGSQQGDSKEDGSKHAGAYPLADRCGRGEFCSLAGSRKGDTGRLMGASLMVLCAGAGTRLRPLTRRVPKPLAPLGDRPMLAHLLSLAVSQGVSRAVVNTHHLAERWQRFSYPSLDLTFSREPELLGTAGGVAFASDQLQAPCVVWNGDILTAPPLAALRAAAVRGDLCLLIAPPAGGDAPGTGTVGLDAAGRVVRLRRERFGQEIRGADYVGVMALGESALAALPGRGCLVGDLCLPWLRAGRSITTLLHERPWLDLGETARLLAANLAWATLLGGLGDCQAGVLERQAGHCISGRITVSCGRRVQVQGSLIHPGGRVVGSGRLRDCVVLSGATAVAPLERAWVLPDESWQVPATVDWARMRSDTARVVADCIRPLAVAESFAHYGDIP